MSRRRSSQPFADWARLALRTQEMMLASAEVIAHRSARLAASGIAPHPQDRAEFARMGREKVEAALECASAAAGHATQASWLHAAHAWQDAWTLGVDLALLATSATPAQALRRHARVVQRLAQPAGSQHAVSSALALSERVLNPLHRRTAANVRRLRRARR